MDVDGGVLMDNYIVSENEESIPSDRTQSSSNSLLREREIKWEEPNSVSRTLRQPLRKKTDRFDVHGDSDYPHESRTENGQKGNKKLNENDVKKAKDLTSILLDTRKVLRADRNILDSVRPNGVDNSLYPKRHAEKSFEPSRSTLIRAERVKSMIALKYLCIQRTYDWAQENKDNIRYPGVQGVYNPLQVVRNRKLRKKHHELPKPLSIHTVPLASNVFSSHNIGDPKKRWKFTWAVELNELVSDSSWVSLHWGEIKNSKGKLWFPPTETNLKTKSKSATSKFSDRIFSSDDSDSKKLFSYNISSSDDDSKFFLLKGPKSNSRKDLLSSYTQFEDFDNPQNGKKNLSDHSRSESFNTQAESHVDGEFSYVVDKDKQLMTPAIKVEGSELSAVTVKPLDKLGDSILPKQSVKSKEEVGFVMTQNDNDISDLDREFCYLNNLISLNLNYVLSVNPQLMSTAYETIRRLSDGKVSSILEKSAVLDDELVPSYEEMYSSFLEEVKSIQHMANDRYAVKVDNLLSGSDRSLGELNTSLSLDLRKVNERLDKLNKSFVSNYVHRADDNGLTMKLSEKGDYEVLYLLLENLIVILLRTIWVIVTIYKTILYIPKKIWNFITFLLYI